MNKNRKNLVFGLLVALIVTAVPGAYALWISGWSTTGAITATSGATTDTVYSFADFAISSDNNETALINYTNPDGTVSFDFDCTMNVASTDSACNYEHSKDLKMYLNKSGNILDCTDNTVQFDMDSGFNELQVILEPSPNRCPLNGTFEILSAFS